MAKKRYINTKFWDDGYIVRLKPLEKYLFLYFLTNSLTELCGVYEISVERISFDVRMLPEDVEEILEKFEKDKKIVYKLGWIFIKNFTEHQSYNENMMKGAKRSYEQIPKEIKEAFRTLPNPSECFGKPEPEPEPELELKPEPESNSNAPAGATKSKVEKTHIREIIKFQQLAIDITEFIPDAKGKKKTSSVFKCCKDNYSAAHAAFLDCKEINKPHVDYFFKVYHEIAKRQIKK